MTELINKQDAINICDKYSGYMPRRVAQIVWEEMKELPPAQPEQRTGKWTLGFDNRYMEKYYYCSCCGGRKYGEYEPLDYFCSNCGAKMVEK